MIEKPKVKLVGEDGNAFIIIGRCHRAAKKAGWTENKWNNIQDEMMAEDYDHLLCTVMNYFEVE